jgi:hypothetical protein
MLCAAGAGAQTAPEGSKPAESKASTQSYETIYLANITQQSDATDIQSALRNMLPRAKVYFVLGQNALTVESSPEDILLARKIVADLDRARKVYRLTYTITEIDNGKQAGSQHLTLLVALGEKTDMKQGIRVPVVTGSCDAGSSTPSSQVQYVDVGLSIEASLFGSPDSLNLRTKVEELSLAEEKSGMGAQDPLIRQNILEEKLHLTQGKPLSLGSLEQPGGTRRQEIEVVAELVR